MSYALSFKRFKKSLQVGQLVVCLLGTACGGGSGAGQSSSGGGSGGAASLPVTAAFSPNQLTLSTSEGAPYANCDFWTDNLTQCSSQSNLGYGPTAIVRMYICLSGEVSANDCSSQPAVTGSLSAAMLTDMDANLAAFQGTGVRLILRFTYNFGPIGPTAMDAPISLISQHIDQLAPILLKYQDLVLALQAGFIGTWGEWHDSTNGNDTAAAHKIVLDKETQYFSGIFPILVRYPDDLLQYTGSSTPMAALGLHDDYYASDSDDGGTWDACAGIDVGCQSTSTTSQLQTYAAAVSTSTMFVGEFGALSASQQTCAALDAYSYTYHAQSIALQPYPATIGTELQNEGCALSFYNKVGTRIEIQSATISGAASPNSQLTFSLTLANTGYGGVLRPRPVTLVFLSNGNVLTQATIPVADMDLRQLASSATPVPVTYQFNVTLPASFPTSGPITAALLIPDPAPSLTSQPAYALPLNSLDQNSNPVFDPTTGYNAIATFAASP